MAQERLNCVSRYSPGNCAPEFLEKILVGRENLVDRMVTKTIRAIESGAGHHWLLVGPRGVGKTHVLAVLRNRILEKDDLRSKFVIGYMCEEERGIDTYLDWIVAILNAFSRWNEGPPDLSEQLSAMARVPLEQAERAAESLLASCVAERTVLIITENLGELFSEKRGFGREGQRRFRDLIQQSDKWLIIASTQSLFEDIRTQDGPFYGFFQIEHLDMLTPKETVLLLQELARHDGRDSLVDYLESPEGVGRVRAIHEITSGNPRLVVLFYEFIEGSSIRDLAAPFQDMIDNLTAFYQEQLNRLSALQEKVVHHLCERRGAATVKEIAQNCFCQPQSIAVQLGRLEQECFVVKTSVGRESHYELREPLMRICYEVKKNLGYPFRLFVDFLGRFYSLEELRRQYQIASYVDELTFRSNNDFKKDKHWTEIRYIEAAIREYHPAMAGEFVGESKEFRCDTDSLAKVVSSLLNNREYKDAARLADLAAECELSNDNLVAARARAHRELGEIDKAECYISQHIEDFPQSPLVWLEKAAIERERCCYSQERDALLRAQELDPNCLDVGTLLTVNSLRVGSLDTVIRELEGLLEQNPRDFHTWAALGEHYLKHKEFSKAINALDKALAERPDDAATLLSLFWAMEATGQIDKAEDYLRRSVQIRTYNDKAWTVYVGRLIISGQGAVALKESKRWAAAHPESFAAWMMRGVSEGYEGLNSDAGASFGRSLDIDPHNSLVWQMLASAKKEEGDSQRAYECVKQAIALNSHNAEAWGLKGQIEGGLGRFADALESLTRALTSAPLNPSFWFFHGLAHLELGSLDAAEQSFLKSLDIEPCNIRTWIQLAAVRHKLKDSGGIDQVVENLRVIRDATSNELQQIGSFLGSILKPDIAMEFFEYAVEKAPRDPLPHFCIAGILYEFGELSKARQALETGISLSASSVDEELRVGTSRAVLHTLCLVFKDFANSISDQYDCYKTVNCENVYIEVLGAELLRILGFSKTFTINRLKEIVFHISKMGDKVRESVPIRLFTTGVRYLDTNDVRVLLELPIEERRVVEASLRSD